MRALNLGILASLKHFDGLAFALFRQRMPSGKMLIWAGYKATL